jgi:hypothetical protein
VPAAYWLAGGAPFGNVASAGFGYAFDASAPIAVIPRADSAALSFVFCW